LFFIQTNTVFRNFSAGGLTVNTWWVWTAFLTFRGGEDILTKATIQLGRGSGVTRHDLLFFVFVADDSTRPVCHSRTVSRKIKRGDA
jgi:hypothetical protein